MTSPGAMRVAAYAMIAWSAIWIFSAMNVSIDSISLSFTSGGRDAEASIARAS